MQPGGKRDVEGSAGTNRSAEVVEIQAEAGQRIDNFLVKILRNVPKSHVYRMLRKGEVRVNGGRVRPTYRLAAGDRVRIPPHRSAPEAQPRAPLARQLERVAAAIVYEDDDFLVLDKPAGLAVHGGSGVSFGAIEALRHLRPRDTLELVHRLDRDTSGCLIVARRRSSLTGVHALLREGRVVKHYSLIVHGLWPAGLTRVEVPLTRYLTAAGERRVRVDAQGKSSRTDFAIERTATRATWLRARLHTGRTHQIRIHAFAAGHGIVGDRKYATAEAETLCAELGIDRLCLHAESVEFPWRDHVQRFRCPPPAELDEVWERLDAGAQPRTR